MKVALTVLFVIAMLVSTTQTLRHVYVKWIEPRASVLDEFRDAIDSSIANAKSVDELVALYRDAHSAVKKYEANPAHPKIEYSERDTTEPYKSEQKIKNEIEAREHDARQLFKLWFYWVCGLVSLSIGVLTFHKVNGWLGFAGIIVGFSEMLCWTSPLFHNRVLTQQFESLLDAKLALSFVTWIILVSMWLLIERGRLLSNSHGQAMLRR